jgi:hypothetical protein
MTISILLAGNAAADNQRAQVNYMLNCQGCHTPGGRGFPDKGVPSLMGFMGKFLQVAGGREFLIQVPGAAQSTLNSAQLAEMTNWMLTTFDPDSITEEFSPYSAWEVEMLRAKKLIEVGAVRAALVEEIQALR